MESGGCSTFALLILSFNFITPLCLCKTVFNSDTDKHALLSFKASIVSDPDAILSTNWSHDTLVCDWTGVSCGLKHPRVTALKLSGYDLAGTLPPHLGNLTFLRYLDISFNNFRGFLPFHLSNLRRLKVMNVASNSFTGEIPSWVGSLPQLQQLDLSNNSFSGKIPKEIGNASSLEILYSNDNQLSGSMPRGIFNASAMRDLGIMHNALSGSLPSDACDHTPNLRALYLLGNQLSGEIPSNIWRCRRLEVLVLSINHFSGNIPNEIGSLNMLQELRLEKNNFQVDDRSLEGKIPATIWECKHLEVLDLSYNDLSGTISREIGNWSMLREFDLSQNHLITGELPQEIGSLPILERFQVFNNSFTGSIPPSIFNSSTLITLALSYNEFSGSLPSDMGHSLFNLEWLLLSSNRLNGPIPTSITNATKLTVLSMAENSFRGSMPSFGNLRLLTRLYIHGNNLRGGAESPTQELTFFSSLTNCRYLWDLEVSNNPLNGVLPAAIGNFSSSLLYFWATNTKIKGVVPYEIGNLSSLLYLYFDGNQFSGLIPPTIGKLKQLQMFYLGGNQLVGSIPNVVCGMNNLGVLSLRGNLLGGPIPKCLGEMKSLRELYLASNQFNSTIPPNLWTLSDLVILNLSSNYFSGQLSPQLGNLRAINSLDLSFNHFWGDIPSIVDGFQSLEILNLSNNEFGGSIPKSLGNIRGLRALDLSNNTLFGFLPKSLANLRFIMYFNVSYNKLQGEIPNEGCFLNLTAQSFFHNSALCGTTRFQVPPCPKNHHGRSRVKSLVRVMKYVAPSLILAVILMIVILILTRRKNHRTIPSPTNDILQSIEWRRVSYIELERGTDSFNETNLLGTGGFGSVFQATLSDGLKVAAKVFDLQLEKAARSFDTESELLSTIRHRNIVHVIGCCSNMEFKALILEYMPNGSLEKWLHSRDYCLDLVQKVKIAIDVALALEYLHHGYTFPIVHCDIKPDNVLLDEDMTARVSDFGIAKLFEKGEDVIQTKTLATIGYAAPEYGSEGKVSTNGDVYSFGILLLEMFTSKKPTDDMFGEEMGLKEWVSEALQENAISEIVDPDLVTREDRHFSVKEQCVSSIFNLAIKCVAISPIERINMIEVAATLQKINATFIAGTTRRQRRTTIVTR